MNQYYQKDLYAILGVSPDCDEAKIKSAYRKQARIWHPDVNDNSQESIVRFKEITEAYEILCDCLLYTSPSPRDTERSRMPSSA